MQQNYERGYAYSKGIGVPQDFSEAAKFYRMAAEKGHVAAQHDLAYLYEHGLGVECDFKQAAEWYRKAALQGDAEAQNNLGALYATGRGVPQSDAEAARWYRLAAVKQDPEAMSNLGTMYLEGRGVKASFAEAFRLFREAAELGQAIAQSNLAAMYVNGQGVPRDYVSAYVWFDIAADHISGCEELRDRIAKEMSSDARQRAHAGRRETSPDCRKTKGGLAMTRRTLLKVALGAAAIKVHAADPPFSLPKLPYAYHALEPYIDAQTMQIHHDKHHQAYVDNLNRAVSSDPSLSKMSVEELLQGLDDLPAAVRTQVRNQGGGHYNHTLFWQILTPASKSGKPSGEFA